jgi:hypothetical protein
VFYLGFKVYPLHYVRATQARVYKPGYISRTEPSRIRIQAIQATGLLIYSYKHIKDTRDVRDIDIINNNNNNSSNINHNIIEDNDNISNWSIIDNISENSNIISKKKHANNVPTVPMTCQGCQGRASCTIFVYPKIWHQYFDIKCQLSAISTTNANRAISSDYTIYTNSNYLANAN